MIKRLNFTVIDPAANTAGVFPMNPPAGKQWTIESATFRFTNGAAATLRLDVTLVETNNPAITYFACGVGQPVSANAVIQVTAAPRLSTVTAAIDAGAVAIGIPILPFTRESRLQIQTNVAAFQIDQWCVFVNEVDCGVD